MRMDRGVRGGVRRPWECGGCRRLQRQVMPQYSIKADRYRKARGEAKMKPEVLDQSQGHMNTYLAVEMKVHR